METGLGCAPPHTRAHWAAHISSLAHGYSGHTHISTGVCTVRISLLQAGCDPSSPSSEPDNSVKEKLPRGPSREGWAQPGSPRSLVHGGLHHPPPAPFPLPVPGTVGPWCQPSPYFRLESSMTRPRTVSVTSSMLAASQVLIPTCVLAGREAGGELTGEPHQPPLGALC